MTRLAKWWQYDITVRGTHVVRVSAWDYKDATQAAMEEVMDFLNDIEVLNVEPVEPLDPLAD